MNQILDFFQEVNDPRVDRTKLHALSDIIGITLCAVIAGADGWDAIRDFGFERKDWLKSFLPLENGIPSSDTIRRVISRLDPVEFQASFVKWVNEIVGKIEGVVAIDGKTICNKKADNPIHLVSAWTNMQNGICLAHVATDQKSNEITAIPTLLDFLDISGCIVTIDAMGCQKNIARAIVAEKEADYCLAVKGNQGRLHAELKAYFRACNGSTVNGALRRQTVEQGHGRTEVRTAYISHDTSAISALSEWYCARSFGLVISQREINGTTSTERRYFISSARLSANAFLHTVRSHWGIENKLHWVLDVTLKEDGNQIAKDHGQQNLATVRKVALRMLKNEETNMSLKRKIFKASLNTSYMAKIIKL